MSNPISRLLTNLSLILACLGLLGGCQPKAEPAPPPSGRPPIVIGVSLLNLSSEFIVSLDQAIRQRAQELEVRLIVNDAQRDAARQVQQVEGFIAQKVDAIILNPCEVEASSPAVDRAVAAGIPIVNVNSETRSRPTAFAGSRDEEAARLAMGFIGERLGGRGNVLMMQGFMGQAAQIKRERGAREMLAANPGLILIAEQTAEWDRAKAVTLMENWIQSHGRGMQAVFAQNDEMGIGAVIALEQAGLKDNVLVVSVDAIADALEMVRQGRLDATVFQDAHNQGSAAVDLAVSIVRGKPHEMESFAPFQLVTRANVDRFLQR